MTLQEHLVRTTQRSLDDLVRSAQAVPAEHQSWEPGGSARSVLSQMQEVAASGAWFLPLVREGRAPGIEEHKSSAQAYVSVEECVHAARASIGELCHEIASYPDEKLDLEVTLPFGGGMTLTMADVLGLAHWNLVYHLGQINQIQLLLGDAEMH